MIIQINAALLSGCSHYYYVANNQNVPLFREKNETNLSGSYGFVDYSQCIEIQAAHSLTNNIGITGSYMRMRVPEQSLRWENGLINRRPIRHIDYTIFKAI